MEVPVCCMPRSNQISHLFLYEYLCSTWWRHQMETFSALLAFVRGIHRSPWRGVLMFSLTCAWINCCVNNREAGDLRRHRAHYNVTVMSCDHTLSLWWRHNERDCVSNHWRPDYLLNRWFRQRSNITSKLRVTGLCEVNHRSTVDSNHKWPATWKMIDDVIMSIWKKEI